MCFYLILSTTELCEANHFTQLIYHGSYNKLSCTSILVASYLRSIGGIDGVTIDSIFLLYYMKQTDFMLPWICTVIDRRRLKML